MNTYAETTRMLRRLLDIVGEEEVAPTQGSTFAELELSRKANEPEKVGELIQFLRGAHEVEELARTTSAAASGSAEILVMDDYQKSEPPAAQIEVIDHIEMGRVVAQWSVDPDTRPANVGELADQLRGVAVVPPGVRKIEFAQGARDTLVINLPAPELLDRTLEAAVDPLAFDAVAMPQFYSDYFHPGLAPVLTPMDMVLARIGDHATSPGR